VQSFLLVDPPARPNPRRVLSQKMNENGDEDENEDEDHIKRGVG